MLVNHQPADDMHQLMIQKHYESLYIKTNKITNHNVELIKYSTAQTSACKHDDDDDDPIQRCLQTLLTSSTGSLTV